LKNGHLEDGEVDGMIILIWTLGTEIVRIEGGGKWHRIVSSGGLGKTVSRFRILISRSHYEGWLVVSFTQVKKCN